ncbi:hypothetical protein ABK040_002482 [Willaertia magna]
MQSNNDTMTTNNTTSQQQPSPPIIKPPFTEESAKLKVQLAENLWNTKNPEKIAMAYTANCEWRNRGQFIKGREEIIKFLTEKYNKELDYKLKKELFSFYKNRISVHFQYEWHDREGQWYRSYGNENWDFDEESGLMRKRDASINDVKINENDRIVL